MNKSIKNLKNFEILRLFIRSSTPRRVEHQHHHIAYGKYCNCRTLTPRVYYSHYFLTFCQIIRCYNYINKDSVCVHYVELGIK